MEIHDIAYLDIPRFESLASQRMSGLTQITTISELVVTGKTKLTEADARAIHEGAGHTTGSVRQIENLDNNVHKFIESLKDDIIDLTADVAKAKRECEEALTLGHFVRARGVFFFNDFRWIQQFGNHWTSTQEALHKMATPSKEERTQFESVKKNMGPTFKMVEFAFGDSIECGVGIGTVDEGIVVKAFLDREHLRIGSTSFIERYGTKTHCHFTILGTVARVGWMGGVDLIDKLTQLTNDDTQAFKKSIESTQDMALAIRRSMSGGEDKTVYLMPLAVYRSSEVKPRKATEEG